MNAKLWPEILARFSSIWRQYSPGRNATVLLDNLQIHHAVAPLIDAKKHGVRLFFLPPNTSHFLQPLDNLVFAIYKTQLAHLANKLLGVLKKDDKLTPAEIITAVTRDAEKLAFSPEKIKASFANCNIWPLDCDAILIAAKINVGLISVTERVRIDRDAVKDTRLQMQIEVFEAYVRRAARKEEVRRGMLAKSKRITPTSEYGRLLNTDTILASDKQRSEKEAEAKREKEALIAEKAHKKEEKAGIAAEKKALKEQKSDTKMMAVVSKPAAKKAKKRPLEDHGILQCHLCDDEWNEIAVWRWCDDCDEFGCCDKESDGASAKALKVHKSECLAPKKKRARKASD